MTHKSEAQNHSPRQEAHWLLDQIESESRLMSDLLRASRHTRLPPAVRAEAQRLAIQTLRGLPLADAVLAPYLRKQPPAPVRMVLRQATVELCLGGAAHGIVNDAVTAVNKGRKTRAMSGLVNAVLRKVARDGPDRWAALEAPRLPSWLRAPMRMHYGDAAVRAMESAHFEAAPLDITLRDADWDWSLLTGARRLPTGSIRVAEAGQVSALPGFATGHWWVQDAAAALPVRGLGNVDGLRVLDLCAAPGGKTLQLAAAGAQVTAVDISERRLRRLRENLQRTGLNAQVIAADAETFRGGRFDAVILDVPCSATGTLRRHPELTLVRDGSELAALTASQSRLLDHAISLLEPGGKLVYCACSLLQAEGEDQIAQALSARPELSVVERAYAFDGIEPGWRCPHGGLRLRPDYWANLGGMDGFYMCCLQRH